MTRLLLIVDMISTWDFEGADAVAEGAEPVVATVSRLRQVDGLRVAFANDLVDGFHGSREQAMAMALAGRRPELVAPLEPEPEDDFIHKGQHSAFYGTPLPHLLRIHEIDELILTGQVTEQCVFYTALDSHVRGYPVTVVTDGVLSQEEHLGAAALEMIESNMGGRLRTASEVTDEVQAG